MNLTSSSFFNSISYLKDIDNYTQEEIESDYVPFVVNKMLAHYQNLIFFVDEMNCSHDIPKEQQLFFYDYLIPKQKRRVLWSNKKKDEVLEIIKEYYKISDDKAQDYKKILTEKQVEVLKSKLNKGGMK